MITKNINSAATNNLQTVYTPSRKGAGAELFSVDAFNAGGAAAYLKLYSKATAAVVGTDLPVMVLALPAAGNGRLGPFVKGVQFPFGIQLALVTGAADTDNTAVAANQIKATLVYGG